MEHALCDSCGRKLIRKKSQIKLAIKHYCSRRCAEKGRRKGRDLNCFICGKLTYKSLKDLSRSQSESYFCGRNCSNVWVGKQRRASNNPNWKGGKSSYRIVMKRNGFLKKCFICGEKDSRILMVHHIDKNRENNNLNNLSCLCYNCHFLVHNYKEVSNKFIIKNKEYVRN